MSARLLAALAVLTLAAVDCNPRDARATPPLGLLDEAATAYAPAERTTPPLPPTVEDMIRAVWPDQLEARAIKIAYRESRFKCCERTWCCWGIFQIHRDHLPWLCGLGFACTTQDLYDPMTNIEAAYRLYQRDGWAPWA